MAEIAGLKLIVPSSVTFSGSGASGTLSSTGKITFTSIPNTGAITIENCFSSSYDNYLFVIRAVSATSDLAIRARYRTGGSDSSTGYTRQALYATSTTVGGQRDTSRTSAEFAQVSHTARSGYHAYVYGPFLAQPTAARTVGCVGTSSATIWDDATTHSVSTSYESVTLFPSTDAITGALTIYGLSQ